MTRRADPLLWPRQARYLDRLRPPLGAAVRAMRAGAAGEGARELHPEVGRLLEALAATMPSGRFLQIGTGIGEAALRLACGAPTASVISIERDAERVRVAAENLERVSLGDRVRVVHGEAIEQVDRLDGPWNLVFFGGDRRDDRRLLDAVLPKLVVGGIVLVDRLLWGGRIADPPEGLDDPLLATVERFNPYFTIHPQLATSLLPVGEGVGLGVKRRPTMRELGGPY